MLVLLDVVAAKSRNFDGFPYGNSSIILGCMYVCHISIHYGWTDRHIKDNF